MEHSALIMNVPARGHWDLSRTFPRILNLDRIFCTIQLFVPDIVGVVLSTIQNGIYCVLKILSP